MSNAFDPWNKPFDPTEMHHAIQGKMVKAHMVFSEATLLSDEDFKDHVRKTLAHELAKSLLRDKLVEITQIKNANDFTVTVNARCFITPDDQVRILRTYGNLQSK